MAFEEPRPTGVTIVAVIAALTGVLYVWIGAIAVAMAGNIAQGGSIPGMGSALGALGVLIGVLGAALLGIGALNCIETYGLLKGRRWGWRLSVATTALTIGVGIAGIAAGIPLGAGMFFLMLAVNAPILVLWAIMLYYMYRPHVRDYFLGGGI